MQNNGFFKGMNALSKIANPAEKQMIEAISGIAAGAMMESAGDRSSKMGKFMDFLGKCEAAAKTPQDVACINLVRGRVAMCEAEDIEEKKAKTPDATEQLVTKLVKLIESKPEYIEAAKEIMAKTVKTVQADAKAAMNAEKDRAADEVINANKEKTETRKEIKEKTKIDVGNGLVDEDAVKEKIRTELTEKFKKNRPENFDNDGKPDEETAKTIEELVEKKAVAEIKKAEAASPEDDDIKALDKAKMKENKVGIKDRLKSLAAHSGKAMRNGKGLKGKVAGLAKGAYAALMGEGVDPKLLSKLTGREAIALCESHGIKLSK